MLSTMSLEFSLDNLLGTEIFICGFIISDGPHGESLVWGVLVGPWGGVYCTFGRSTKVVMPRLVQSFFSLTDESNYFMNE